MNLIELSFRNLVNFYQEELYRIRDGENSMDVFSEHARSYLVRNGVIERSRSHRRNILTDETQRILGVEE